MGNTKEKVSPEEVAKDMVMYGLDLIGKMEAFDDLDAEYSMAVNLGYFYSFLRMELTNVTNLETANRIIMTSIGELERIVEGNFKEEFGYNVRTMLNNANENIKYAVKECKDNLTQGLGILYYVDLHKSTTINMDKMDACERNMRLLYQRTKGLMSKIKIVNEVQYSEGDTIKIPWKKIIIGLSLLFILVVIPLVAASNSEEINEIGKEIHQSNEKDANYTPVAEPSSGKVLYGMDRMGHTTITVTASSSEACVVKLKGANDETKLMFYVRAGETVTKYVLAEYMQVYFASGDTWYGEELLFGEDTSYSMDDELINFAKYSIEYTLYPVSNGNFSETPIDASQF